MPSRVRRQAQRPPSDTPAPEPSKGKRSPRTYAILGLAIPVFFGSWEISHLDTHHDPPTTSTIGKARFVAPHGFFPLAGSSEAIATALSIPEFRSLAPSGDFSRGLVLVGISHGEGPHLLSPEATARLGSSGTPSLMRVGAYMAVLVVAPLPIAEDPTSRGDGLGAQTAPHMGTIEVTLYSIPVLSGSPPTSWTTVNVVCVPTRTAPAQLLQACGELSTTLELQEYGVAFDGASLSGYHKALTHALARYYREGLKLRKLLHGAPHAGGEEARAEQLASLCRAVARSVEVGKLPLNPIALPAQRRLRSGLALQARGYKALASASARGRPRAWTSARRQVAGGERVVTRALAGVLAP
jgi:hypothetical protein